MSLFHNGSQSLHHIRISKKKTITTSTKHACIFISSTYQFEFHIVNLRNPHNMHNTVEHYGLFDKFLDYIDNLNIYQLSLAKRRKKTLT